MAIDCILNETPFGHYDTSSSKTGWHFNEREYMYAGNILVEGGGGTSYGTVCFKTPDIEDISDLETLCLTFMYIDSYSNNSTSIGLVYRLFEYNIIEADKNMTISELDEHDALLIKDVSVIPLPDIDTLKTIDINVSKIDGLEPNTDYAIIFSASAANIIYPGDDVDGDGIIEWPAGVAARIRINSMAISLRNENHIRYHLNGGYGDIDSFYISDGGSFNITDISPLRDTSTVSTEFNITGNLNYNISNIKITATKLSEIQYTFLGWSEDISATTPTYTRGQYVSNVTKDMTLYAVWEQTEISTVYINNAISNLGTPIRDIISNDCSITLIDTLSNSEFILTKDIITQYIFKGWSLDPNSEVVLSNDTEFIEETNLYAVWESSNIYDTIDLPNLIKPTYTEKFVVKLNTNLGYVNNNNLIASRDHIYTHHGWSLNKDSDVHVSDPYTLTESVTLYSHWTEDIVDHPVDLPIPSKIGNEFLGWSTTDSPNEYIASPYMPDRSKIVLNAIWNILNKTISQMYIYHDGNWHHTYNFNE